MPEPEEVIVDAARHATDYVQGLWRRHRQRGRHAQRFGLIDVLPRLDLVITAVYGRSFPLRVAQAPAPETLLSRIFRRHEGPRQRASLPSTDGVSIWLPSGLGPASPSEASARYRLMALQQAMRAVRGSAQNAPDAGDPLLRDVYLLLEAFAAEHQLVRLLPGMQKAAASVRDMALALRPALTTFPAHLKPLEQLTRRLYSLDLCAEQHQVLDAVLPCGSPQASLALAQDWAARLKGASARGVWGPHPVMKDRWLGELRRPSTRVESMAVGEPVQNDARSSVSVRLRRRPEVREAEADEDDEQPGLWMVQTSQPHEQVEDPIGLQRPTDRDDTTAAEEFADAMSELPEARLVTTPGRSREVLLSEDAPERRFRAGPRSGQGNEAAFTYPEWDYRISAYHSQGAVVQELPVALGPKTWIDKTLYDHRGMLHEIRRRFELLRCFRVRVSKQLDGDEIDLAAYTEGYADFRAGLTLPQRLYQTHRRSHRDMAIMLLIDVSGSTDSWVADSRRIIDVEREALLLVCFALEGMGQPYAVQAFSGEGAQAVVVRTVKRFEECFDDSVAQRIAGLEPEHYTRAGAALRHATALLMKQSARHRLLLLLSDGKPNDVDQYEGRYGVEDLRQAVTEARLQGISPFCLTIDRQAASYLPLVFGANQYALLTHPELLPKVLLDWLRRLVRAGG